MSEATAAKITAILRALSPLRWLLMLWREFFASTGPGRKLARDAMAIYCYLTALPVLKEHPDALVYATILVFSVLTAGQVGQALIGDKLKARAPDAPEVKP